MPDRQAEDSTTMASDPPGLLAQDPAAGSVASLRTLATIVVVCAILYVAQDLFRPLALGMLIAFILTPVVNFLRRRGLRDTASVVLTVLAAAALVGSFVLILAYQISQIGANLPLYQGNVLTKVDTMLDAGNGRVITHLQGLVENITERLEAETAASEDATMKVEVVEHTGLRDWLTGVILPALTPVGIFGLVFVVVIFALLERAALRDRLVQLIGGTNILATSRLLAEAGSRVSTYLVAQLVVNIIYAVPIWLGLWLIGVPNALFFGLVTLVLRFVPYLGSAISAALPLLMAFAVSPDWSLVLWTAALFLLVEFTTSNFIEPWFYGQRTGVSPLAVIVAAMFWTWLWGPVGLIMATPLTVCLVVVGHHVPSLRLFPIMLGDKPVLADSARLYDRLLAGHSFAFTEAAAHSTAQHYLADYYDRSAIPALALAQADHGAGLLSDYQTNRIARSALMLTEDLEAVVEDELATASEATDKDPKAPLATNGLLDGIDRRVAVMGARTVLDDAAAQMLAQALRAEGAQSRWLHRRSALPRALDDLAPETLILVTLDPVPPRAVDYQLRQLRRRLPGVRIGLALWPPQAGEGERETVASADFVTQGMEETLAAAFRPPQPAAA